MRMKIVNSLNDDDVAINQQLSNIMINRYRAGLAKQESQDIAEDSGNTGTVDVVNPTETIKVANPKKIGSIKSGLKVSQGYSSKKQFKIKSTSSTAATTSSATAKEFITQSRVFDNELDHMVALMKLNNKQEFYAHGFKDGDQPEEEYTGGTLFTEDEKEHYTSLNVKQLSEIVEDLNDKLFGQDSDDEDTGNDINEYQANLAFIEKLIKDKTKEMKKNKESYEGKQHLKKAGYDALDRERFNTKGNIDKFKNMSEQNYDDTTTGANKHRKSKNGIRVVSETDVKMFGTELLLSIKKLANLLTVTLLPLAQTLYDSRFQGMSYHELQIVPELYTDMDEKLYILTSLNNQNNTQLVKLDKDFEKLHTLVESGVKRYVPPTGGSMSGGSFPSRFSYTPGKVNTKFPNLL